MSNLEGSVRLPDTTGISSMAAADVDDSHSKTTTVTCRSDSDAESLGTKFKTSIFKSECNEVNKDDGSKLELPSSQQSHEPSTDLLKITSSTVTSSPNTSHSRGSGSSVSKRGSRGNSGRGGTRQYGKRKKPSNHLQSLQQYDLSEFHASLFSGLPDVSKNVGLTATPGYLSRDVMLQLTSNINSGFFYINSAFELLKQSQLELYHAKQVLESIYRIQHGGDLDSDSPYSDGVGNPNGDKDEKKLDGENKLTNNSHLSSPEVAESLQLNLDPFQFMPTSAPEFNKGRGESVKESQTGVRRSRRAPGVQRQKRRNEYFSNYKSEISQQGLKNLLKHLTSSDNLNHPNTAGLSGQPVIVLHDLKPILDKKREVMPKVYSAKKVEASYNRRELRSGKTSKQGNSKDNLSLKVEDDSQMQVSQNSQISIPSQKEEHKVTNRKPKVPVTTDCTTASDSNISKRGGNKTLPRWRQLRVDPDVMERIKLRIQEHQLGLNNQFSSDSTDDLGFDTPQPSPEALHLSSEVGEMNQRKSIGSTIKPVELGTMRTLSTPKQQLTSPTANDTKIKHELITPPDDLTPEKNFDCIKNDSPEPENHDSNMGEINKSNHKSWMKSLSTKTEIVQSETSETEIDEYTDDDDLFTEVKKMK